MGSLNGLSLSLFEKGNEVEAKDFLIKMWKSIKSSEDIYVNWKPWGILGPIYSLFYESGFFDTSPLKELI